MKTIHIQGDAKCKRLGSFTVLVNGQPHKMRNGAVNVQVDDNRPFRIKVKRGWRGSLVYTFDPADDMRLQVHSRRKLIHRGWLILVVVIAMSFAGMPLRRRRFMSFFPSDTTLPIESVVLCILIAFIVEWLLNPYSIKKIK